MECDVTSRYKWENYCFNQNSIVKSELHNWKKLAGISK